MSCHSQMKIKSNRKISSTAINNTNSLVSLKFPFAGLVNMRTKVHVRATKKSIQGVTKGVTICKWLGMSILEGVFWASWQEEIVVLRRGRGWLLPLAEAKGILTSGKIVF